MLAAFELFCSPIINQFAARPTLLYSVGRVLFIEAQDFARLPRFRCPVILEDFRLPFLARQFLVIRFPTIWERAMENLSPSFDLFPSASFRWL